jgi:hypothetical protein
MLSGAVPYRCERSAIASSQNSQGGAWIIALSPPPLQSRVLLSANRTDTRLQIQRRGCVERHTHCARGDVSPLKTSAPHPHPSGADHRARIAAKARLFHRPSDRSDPSPSHPSPAHPSPAPPGSARDCVSASRRCLVPASSCERTSTRRRLALAPRVVSSTTWPSPDAALQMAISRRTDG